MKASLKVISAVAAAAFACAASYAQEVEFSSTTTVNPVTVTSDGASFEEVSEELTVDLTSEKVDAGLDVTFATAKDDEEKLSGIEWFDPDFYVAFRPVDMITLGFSYDINPEGSYLYVADTNTSTGNLGSEGITFAFTGVEGLTVALNSDFPTVFATEDEKFNLGFGTIYSIGETGLEIAVSGKNLINDSRSIGAYVSYEGIEGLYVGAGYAYQEEIEDVGIEGDNVINLSASYENDALNAGVDFVTTTDDDVYYAATFGYNVTDFMNLAFTASVNTVYSDFLQGGEYTLTPAATFTFGNHEIGCEADVVINDGFDNVSFPVYYKYSF